MKANAVELFREIIKQKIYPIQENVTLDNYTSLNIGGPASFFFEPEHEQQLKEVLNLANELDIPYHFIGNGSNILVSDYGFEGLIVLSKTSFKHIWLEDDTTIVAKSGALLKEVCLFALQHNLTGLEFAFGIPASVGGAIYMNAGAYGGEMVDVVSSCSYMDEQGSMKTLSNKELCFSYRESFFTHQNVFISEAKFSLNKGDPIAIKTRMDELFERRKSKQPLEYPSAGSTFKRPEGHYASALIEQSGLKGHSFGGAQVSNKHAGFLINKKAATSKDFLCLIYEVRDIVKEKHGVDLEFEVKMIGHCKTEEQ